jgi:hypothetical protein
MTFEQIHPFGINSAGKNVIQPSIASRDPGELPVL